MIQAALPFVALAGAGLSCSALVRFVMTQTHIGIRSRLIVSAIFTLGGAVLAVEPFWRAS